MVLVVEFLIMEESYIGCCVALTVAGLSQFMMLDVDRFFVRTEEVVAIDIGRLENSGVID